MRQTYFRLIELVYISKVLKRLAVCRTLIKVKFSEPTRASTSFVLLESEILYVSLSKKQHYSSLYISFVYIRGYKLAGLVTSGYQPHQFVAPCKKKVIMGISFNYSCQIVQRLFTYMGIQLNSLSTNTK